MRYAPTPVFERSQPPLFEYDQFIFPDVPTEGVRVTTQLPAEAVPVNTIAAEPATNATEDR